MNEILMLDKYNCAVKKDDDNMLLFGYDIEDGEYKNYTEGILREVCQDMADEIEKAFSIIIENYGAIRIEEVYEIKEPVNNVSFALPR